MNVEHSYAPLFFFYNISSKEIRFASQPFETFFGSAPDLKKEPPFLPACNDNDTENITKEWQSCLQLKEKETRNFSFNTTTAENNLLLFDCSVLGIGPSSFGDSPGLLVHIKKIAVRQSLSLQNKSAANYRKDYAEFIELAAHDLDAPLRKLSVLIERLVNKIDPTSDDVAGYITRIQTCLSDMRSMLDSLSLLATFSDSVQKKDSCDINAIIREIIDELLSAGDDTTSVEISDPLPVLHGDRKQYKELFRNLIKNAMLFRNTEKVTAIEFNSGELLPGEKDLVNLEGGRSYHKIIVADNGIGFRQEYAEKIFQPFVRLHGKSEYPGHGMGLAICKKIVENHQGIIYADGNADEGARFTLILPKS